MTNLSGILETTAAAFPDRTAIIAGNRRRSYRELEAAANRVANLLTGHGVRAGDRVVLTCDNRPEFAETYFGILKAGAIVVPLNTMLKTTEVVYHLRDCDPVAVFAVTGSPAEAARAAIQQVQTGIRLYVTGSKEHDEARSGQPDTYPSVPVDDDDTAVILYTSGTTGQPKGAELRHRNLRDNAAVGGALFGCSVERHDVYLCALPLFHSYGQSGTQNTAITFASTVVMMPRFDPAAAVDLMRTEGVTMFAGVPTMFWRLVSQLGGGQPLKLPLRIALSGGAALSVELHRRFESLFGVAILEGYGLSETSPLVCSARPGERVRPGSVGRAVPGVQMRLIDADWGTVSGDDRVGEIAVRGHNVMKGYWNRPAATAESIRDGWLRTGDLARRDDDDFYYIVDRAKDLIIRGGYNVYPRELEELLMTHPRVSLVAVVGIADPALGEEVKAVIVPTAGPPLREGDIVGWTKERVAAYKYPRLVEFRSELPLTSTGKILKRAL